MASVNGVETSLKAEDKDGTAQSEAAVGQQALNDSPTSELPDGGWGWVIVFGAGAALSIVGGFNKGMTLLYQELLCRFEQSAGATALVPAIAGTVRMVSSPVVSALCDRFTHRRAAMAAGVVTAVAFILSAFVPSLPWLYFTFGVLQGFGVSLMIVSGTSIVNLYFFKNRGKANALSFFFLSAGAMYMAPLLSALFAEYAYSGTMLIMGALMLNAIPAGALFRPPDLRASAAPPPTVDEPTEEDIEMAEAGEQVYVQVNSSETVLRPNSSSPEKDVKTSTSDTNTAAAPPAVDGDLTGGHPCVIDVSSSRSGTTADRGENWKKCCLKSRAMKLLCRLPTILGCGALKEATFCALAFLMASYSVVNSCSMSLLSGLVLENGLPKDQVPVLMSVSFGVEMVCRLLGGIFFDLKWVRPRRPTVFTILGVIVGLLTVCQPFVRWLVPTFIMWSLQLGFAGAFQAQGPTVLATLVPRSKITSSVGVVRLIQGLGNMAGASIGGMLYDKTGSYGPGFIVAGAQFSLVSFFALILFSCCLKEDGRLKLRTK